MEAASETSARTVGKKKGFINKKTAQHFHVVHRSTRDPRKDDPEASEYVLLSTKKQVEFNEDTNGLQTVALKRNAGKSTGFLGDDRLNDFGDDDGYDYSKHMKEMGGGVFVSPSGDVDHSGKGTQVGIALPDEVLPGEEQERIFESIAVANKYLDPEILSAFDDPDAFEDMKEEFVEDFDAVGQDGREEEFDYEAHIARLMENAPSDEDEDEEFTDDEDDAVDQERTEHQELLDEQFEKAMLDYDDENMGELQSDDEEIMDGGIDLDGDLLDGVLDEFLEQKTLMNSARTIHNPESLKIRAKLTAEVLDTDKPTKLTTRVHTQYPDQLVSDSDEDEGEAGDTFQSMKVDGGAFQRKLEKDNEYMRPKSKAQWDCETIISTYSNLENHPSEIGIPTNLKRKKKTKKAIRDAELELSTLENLRLAGDQELEEVELSRKTGLPIGVLPTFYDKDGEEGEEEEEEEVEYEDVKDKGKKRDKGETKEQKKARKKAVKAAKALRVKEKKMLKEAYTAESRKQERCAGNGRGQSIFTY